MYSLPRLDLNVFNMIMQYTISRQIYALVFVRGNFTNLLIVHINRWMIWLIYFSRENQRFRFEGLKVTSHIDAHISILERSVFSLMVESRGLSTTM